MIYNLGLEQKEKIDDSIKNCVVLFSIISILCYCSGLKYKFNYNITDYESTKDIIAYTSQDKQNVYLYTVPSLQFRYLAYSVYENQANQTYVRIL